MRHPTKSGVTGEERRKRALTTYDALRGGTERRGGDDVCMPYAASCSAMRIDVRIDVRLRRGYGCRSHTL